MQSREDEAPIRRNDRRRETSGSLRVQVDDLRHALGEAREGPNSDTRVLRDAVAVVAIGARAEHVPPERLLILIKRMTNDRVVSHLSQWWRRVLTDRCVRWGIEGYYGVPDDSRRE